MQTIIRSIARYLSLAIALLGLIGVTRYASIAYTSHDFSYLSLYLSLLTMGLITARGIQKPEAGTLAIVLNIVVFIAAAVFFRSYSSVPVRILLGFVLIACGVSVIALLLPASMVVPLYRLAIKNMRQRALGTWLTLLSVVLGVALAVAVLLLRQGGESLFAQTDYGYDLIIGKGSPTQLVLNTVYHIDQSPGNLPYSVYESLLKHPQQPGRPHPRVKLAVPIAVGDTYKGRRIIATLPTYFGYEEDGTRIPDGTEEGLEDRVLRYRKDKRFEFQDGGRVFHPKKFEAVIGSEVTKLTGLKLGDKFQASHDAGPDVEGHVHAELWEVVGVLKPTHTANDRVVFIPLVTTYAIADHDKGLREQEALRKGQPMPRPATKPEAKEEDHDHGHDHDHDHGHPHEEHDHESYVYHADGTIDPKLPKDQWVVSAIFVKARSAQHANVLEYEFRTGAVGIAARPATEMAKFFDTFVDNITTVLLVIAILVSVVAGVGILVSIYNSVAARMREIAILRALGATKARVLTLICVEAGLIGLLGGIFGLVVGHAIGAIGSGAMERMLGQGFNWMAVGREELYYVAGVVVIAVLAGLVPALKAYRTPVATNLVAV